MALHREDCCVSSQFLCLTNPFVISIMHFLTPTPNKDRDRSFPKEVFTVRSFHKSEEETLLRNTGGPRAFHKALLVFVFLDIITQLN